MVEATTPKKEFKNTKAPSEFTFGGEEAARRSQWQTWRTCH